MQRSRLMDLNNHIVLVPVDGNLTLMDKWNLPTRLVPTYYWGAKRNALSLAPGTLSIIFLSLVIYRRPGIYRQYQYTVMFITFGGFLFMLPVFLFNFFVALLVSVYDGGVKEGINQTDYNTSFAHSFQTSVFACSLTKQIVTATMNSNFCIGFVISLMRYFLFLWGLQMTWLRIFICSAAVMSPNFLLLLYVMFFGVITDNDCCERILEVPQAEVPVYYYSYLMFILIAAILVNIRTLFFLTRMKEQIKDGTLSTTKSQRDQFRLSLGFLLQSFAPFLSFGSYLVFMVLYLNGIMGPEWFSTITNTACCLSTLINPAASMAFIPIFRQEFVAILSCQSTTPRRLSSNTVVATTPITSRKPS